MSDIIERAEALLTPPVVGSPAELVLKRDAIIRELVAELKAARAQIDSERGRVDQWLHNGQPVTVPGLIEELRVARAEAESPKRVTVGDVSKVTR